MIGVANISEWKLRFVL